MAINLMTNKFLVKDSPAPTLNSSIIDCYSHIHFLIVNPENIVNPINFLFQVAHSKLPTLIAPTAKDSRRL